ncbi:MAG: hypothetical protein LBR70_04730 [Lactobacillaceae bacterium]|nr:hypothetical protein [Lactobacillaceae bacterium]
MIKKRTLCLPFLFSLLLAIPAQAEEFDFSSFAAKHNASSINLGVNYNW